VLGIGAYIFGVSFKMLELFFPLVQLVLIVFALSIFLAVILHPVKTLKMVINFFTEEEGKKNE